MSKTSRLRFLAALFCMLLIPSQAHAYIGPGAGFALAGSFLAVFAAVFSSLLLLLTWPARLIGRVLRGQRALAHARVKRVVILGLDGLDYRLTAKLLSEGKLPHMAALRGAGLFQAFGHHGAVHFSGGMVLIPDGSQPWQAQHF